MGEQDPTRLLVLAPNWLGDVVMALPALADLRKRFADATLVVAARRGLGPIFECVPGVDQIVVARRAARRGHAARKPVPMRCSCCRIRSALPG